MTPKPTELRMDGRGIKKLVPTDESSPDRFEAVRYSAEVVPASNANGATVSGRLLAAMPAAVMKTSGSFEEYTWEILAEAGARPIDEHDWYAQETALAVLAHLQDVVGEQVVERVGRFLPELLEWPRDVTTFTEALEAVDDWYRAVHRDDDATVTFTTTGPSTGELRLATPYPTGFENGLVRGLVLQFSTDGTYVWTTSARDTDGETVYRFVIRTVAGEA